MVFINAGGIRAGLTKGNITLANIISVSPYDNEVILVTLTGKDILDLLKIACKKCSNTRKFRRRFFKHQEEWKFYIIAAEI